MKAAVTIRFIVSDVCLPEDIDDDYTFEDLVTELVREEGIAGIADDIMTPQIIRIEEVPE